jgi:DNA-directed RNA polymerase subunit RPC12/RpoP
VAELSRLDGNAAAGGLEEVFAVEITTAVATCAGCGATGEVGELIVYADAPGTVIRCPACGSVVMRYARLPQSTRIDLRGAAVLRIPQETRRT